MLNYIKFAKIVAIGGAALAEALLTNISDQYQPRDYDEGRKMGNGRCGIGREVCALGTCPIPTFEVNQTRHQRKYFASINAELHQIHKDCSD